MEHLEQLSLQIYEELGAASSQPGLLTNVTRDYIAKWWAYHIAPLYLQIEHDCQLRRQKIRLQYSWKLRLCLAGGSATFHFNPKMTYWILPL